jgi:folate-binding protein YgfZ
MNQQLNDEYESLTLSVGYVVLADRSYVRMTGEDRKKQLHSFCTAEINALESGQVTEAFVLNTKGKILGFVHVLNGTDDLLLTSHGQQAETLIGHLDKYVIREDVNFFDDSSEFKSVFVCGALAKTKLESALSVSPDSNRFETFEAGNVAGTIAAVEIAGDGFLLVVKNDQLAGLTTLLEREEIAACSDESLQSLRVSNRTPWFGVDLDESNLPQELQRDDKAISFEKGCYLGQETVARIDALGQVNQLMVGLKFAGNDVTVGDEFKVEDKVVGRVTSVAYSVADQCWIGMGYVRRKYKDAGTVVGNATVV